MLCLTFGCIPKSADHSNDTTADPITFSLGDDPHQLAENLSHITTLDSGQAAAMVSALRHEVALIQGPPGTGKSYVGIQIARTLATDRERLGLGPILCV
jgi:superfamily II DNA or RNA helicase